MSQLQDSHQPSALAGTQLRVPARWCGAGVGAACRRTVLPLAPARLPRHASSSASAQDGVATRAKRHFKMTGWCGCASAGGVQMGARPPKWHGPWRRDRIAMCSMCSRRPPAPAQSSRADNAQCPQRCRPTSLISASSFPLAAARAPTHTAFKCPAVAATRHHLNNIVSEDGFHPASL